jgi:hypothetical protein
MSRITIADLNTVNQVTELSEVELAATKGGTFCLIPILFGCLFGGYGGSYGGGYGGGGCAPKPACH